MSIRLQYAIYSAIALLAAGSYSFAQTNLPAPTGPSHITLTFVTNTTPALSTNDHSLQPQDQKDEARAAELLHRYNSDLIFVTGKIGAASGFIAQYKNRRFFITNAHVLAGLGYLSLEPLDRSTIEVQADASLVAVGHDLITIPVNTGGDGIPTMDKVDTDVTIGDSVVVLSNSLAGGVVNTLLGKVVGIGPRIIEVTGQFESGSSGGPIIHLRSGKVIGVATYATRSETISGEQSTRRFGYRLDSVTAWQRLDFKRFQYESDTLDAVHRLTRQIADAVDDTTRQLPQQSAQVVQVDGRKVIVPPKQIMLRHQYESPLIRDAVGGYLTTVIGKPGNNDDAAAVLLDTLGTASQNNLAAAAPRFTYDFFIHGDAEIPGWSREEANGFEYEKRARTELFRELTARLQRK